MISLDTALLTQTIGNSRSRHEAYAEQAGRLSLVILTLQHLADYHSDRVQAVPTRSRSYFHYLWDGYRAAMRIHEDCPVDLIATQDPFLTALIGLALRRRLHKPLIIQDHSCVIDNAYFRAESRRNQILQWLARWTIQQANAVRVVNRIERDACIAQGVDANRVCVIPVAPDLTHFQQPAPEAVQRWRERLNLTAQTPVVIWVGRPVAFKNLPLLLNAFREVRVALPEARLLLAGAEIASAQNDPPGVQRIGPVPHTELAALYGVATVYAHTSNYEGFGVVLVEAAAAGLPVVSTATAGALESVVDGVTGRLVPIGDAEILAKTLIAVLSDPGQAHAMGIQAQQHVQTTFNEQHLLAQWVAMWQTVAKGDAPCAS